MKKNYIVFKLYMNNPDGYLWVLEGHNKYTSNIEYATRLTLKQAQKFTREYNNEMIKNYSYYSRCGYTEIFN